MALARQMGASILSVDSMQVYRGMDIGTAKASAEEQAEIRHHMLDLVDPEREFSVAEFQSAGREIIASADTPVVIAGGSGLHFRALVDPFEFGPTDPAIRAELESEPAGVLTARLAAIDPDAPIDTSNPRRVIRALETHALTGETPSERATRPSVRAVAEYRPMFPLRAVGLDPGDLAPQRAAARLGEMRRRGLLAEVAALRGRLGRTASQAVGYKELIPVVDGGRGADEGFAMAERATIQLIKRQRTYFRRDPRIHWLPWCEDVDVLTGAALEVFS